MLVLFIYTSSLAANEIFSFPSINIIISTIIVLITAISLNLMDLSLLNFPSSPYSLTLNYINVPYLVTSTFKFFVSSSFIITLLLVFYLFLALVAVVKVTNINGGPLRPSFDIYVKTYTPFPSITKNC